MYIPCKVFSTNLNFKLDIGIYNKITQFQSDSFVASMSAAVSFIYNIQYSRDMHIHRIRYANQDKSFNLNIMQETSLLKFVSLFYFSNEHCYWHYILYPIILQRAIGLPETDWVDNCVTAAHTNEMKAVDTCHNLVR